MPHKNHSTIYRKDYQVPVFLIDDLYLNFILGDTDCVVNAKTSFRKNPDSPEVSGNVFLDGQNLDLLSIAVDAQSY